MIFQETDPLVEDFSLCLGYGNQELSLKNIKKSNQQV